MSISSPASRGSAPNPPLLAAGAIGGNSFDPAYGMSTQKNRSGHVFFPCMTTCPEVGTSFDRW